MEQLQIDEKTSAFVNIRRRAAGAPRAEPIDTAKTYRDIFSPLACLSGLEILPIGAFWRFVMPRLRRFKK
jgi:hypothetical protein